MRCAPTGGSRPNGNAERSEPGWSLEVVREGPARVPRSHPPTGEDGHVGQATSSASASATSPMASSTVRAAPLIRPPEARSPASAASAFPPAHVVM